MTIPEHAIEEGLRDLRLDSVPIIVHASLKACGHVEGGAGALVNALVRFFPSILAPAFTYKTMVTPLVGPENNALVYGTGRDANRMAEFFTPSMQADPLIGLIPETLRRHPRAKRSGHPILSFAGINAGSYIAAQTLDEPLGPIGELEKADGWVLLMGVDHTVNTSIHLVEKLAGRRTFIRWALTPQGVRQCPSFPGCSLGFNALPPKMDRYIRRARIGEALVQALPLRVLFDLVLEQINDDPQALLCRQRDCSRCNQIRLLM